MALSKTDLPAVRDAVRNFRQVIADSPVGIIAARAKSVAPALAIALEQLAAALHPSNPGERIDPSPMPGCPARWPPFLLGNSNEDLHHPATDLPPRVVVLVNELWDKLGVQCQHGFPLNNERERMVWLDRLDRTEEAIQGGSQGHGRGEVAPGPCVAAPAFEEFSPKGRKLLLALRGKGRVPLADVQREVHGRRVLDRTARRALLALARRAGDALPAKGYAGLVITLEGNTLELLEIPSRPGPLLTGYK